MQQWLPNGGGTWSSGCLQSACLCGFCSCMVEGVCSGTKESWKSGLGQPPWNDRGLTKTSSWTSTPFCPNLNFDPSIFCSNFINKLSMSKSAKAESSRSVELAWLGSWKSWIGFIIWCSWLSFTMCPSHPLSLGGVLGGSCLSVWDTLDICRWAR